MAQVKALSSSPNTTKKKKKMVVGQMNKFLRITVAISNQCWVGTWLLPILPAWTGASILGAAQMAPCPK
jgi:hypothetical protein